MNITNQTYRLATEDFILHQPVDDFVFEGAVGFNALIDFMSCNEEFELEVAMVYLDKQGGIDSAYPKLPMTV
ncbi:hypothetical protein N9V27_01305 [bacterium]|jgi:hypothetical protein|nr:hypothetical protein [bacterium]